ncbi:Lrp/AsnC family leucine-responsive transcriptional regulator [Rhodococcus sp. OK519]|nr:Lrp/AsnC family leucine-responsive transcriptional regulator [Rhodococcus sp. OK519]
MDRFLIDALVQNGRVPFTTLAAQVGVSGTTVCRRLAALEQRGVIRRYTVVVDPGALGHPTTALFSIKPRVQAPARRSIADRLRRLPEITASFTMSGDRPNIAVGRFTSPDAAESMAIRLREDLGARVNIDFVLKTRFGDAVWSPDSSAAPALRDTDRVMIDVLMMDGRASLDSLAKKTHLSKSTVHKRLQVLQERGVIRGYTTLVDSGALGLPVTAIFGIKSGAAAAVEPSKFGQLHGFPEIGTCYTLSGRRAAVAVGAYRDIAAARTAADRLGEQLNTIVNVDFVLATDFDRHQWPQPSGGGQQCPYDEASGHLQPVR